MSEDRYKKGLDEIANFLMRESFVNDEMPRDPYDWFDEQIDKPIKAIICAARGHDVEQDQCGRPEHDYCLLCGELRPGEAH